MDLRKLTDKRLQLEKKFVEEQITNTLREIQDLVNLLGQRKLTHLSGLKMIDDLEEHYRQFRNIMDEIEYRNIP